MKKAAEAVEIENYIRGPLFRFNNNKLPANDPDNRVVATGMEWCGVSEQTA